MNHLPMPMEYRKCKTNRCFNARRYYRAEGSTDIYICKCGELTIFDGKDIEIIRSVDRLMESVEKTGEFKMVTCG